MNKIITLLMLLTLVFGGSSLAEAKGKKVSGTRTTRTTQTSGSSTFSAATLLYKDKAKNLIALRKGISGKLTAAGFKRSGNTFTKPGIKVVLEEIDMRIIIHFDDTTSRNDFINSTKSLGFKWDGLECLNGLENCMHITVEENTVMLSGCGD